MRTNKHGEHLEPLDRLRTLGAQVEDPNPYIALEAIRQIILTPEGSFARNPLDSIAMKGEAKPPRK